jgi:hypothetical protein
MQLFLINILPPGIFMLFVMLLIAILVSLTFFIVKNFVSKRIAHEPQKFLEPLIGLVSTSYAVLLGLLIVTAWGWFLKAEAGTYKEAADLSLLTYYALNMPLPVQNEALEAIGQYIYFVTHDEWLLQRYGQTSIKTQEALNHLFEVFHDYKIGSTAEINFHLEISETLSGLVKHRFLRISKLESILSIPLRLALFFGVVLITFLFSLYEIKRKTIHLFTLIAFTSILSFNIALALLLDYPYSGQYSISSKAFTEGILSRFDRDTPPKPAK